MSANQNFSKPALAIIAVLLIVTSISLYFAISNSCCKPDQTSATVPSDTKTETTSRNNMRSQSLDSSSVSTTTELDSDTISEEDARKCTRQYLKNNKCLMMDSAGTRVQLRGFSFKAQKIKPLLSNMSLDRIYLQLAVRPNLVDSPARKQEVTLIMMGMDALGNRVLDPSTSRPYLYEYARPCPNNCPK